MPLKHYQLTVENPTLPSIPLFTLAGYFLAESGAAKRLVRLFNALFGGFRGGPAIVTALVCAFFTSFTGGVRGHRSRWAECSCRCCWRRGTRSGRRSACSPVRARWACCSRPACRRFYAIIASAGGETSVSIEDMFLGGFLPGMVLVVLTAWWGVRAGPPLDRTTLPPFRWSEAWSATWEAKWELGVPVVALTALFSGFATPVEAAALTAFYTFIVDVVIQRELRLFRDVPRVMTECGLLVGGVMLILGVALGFTHYLVDAQIPDQAVAWATSPIKSKWVFLLLLNVVLLVVGGLVEIYAAIVVVVPLLVPIGNAFGIDPIHLGIIFLANMELGFLAPPVGLNLLLASYRFQKPIGEVMRASLPMLAVMVVGVLLITYVPALTTWLPHLLRR